MPSEIRIYFEGDKSLKAGFDAFLQGDEETSESGPMEGFDHRHRRDSRAGFRYRDEKASGALEHLAPRQRRPLEPEPVGFALRETRLAILSWNPGSMPIRVHYESTTGRFPRGRVEA
jgi:hypothetical protein